MREIGYPRVLLSILFLMSINSVTSLSYCHLPINQTIIQSVIRRDIELAAGHGVDNIIIHLQRMKLTCLASRGIDQYNSASVVAQYTVTVLGVNQAMVNQFQLSCKNGVWGYPTDHSAFDVNKPPMPFEIPIEKQCSECTESLQDLAMPYYDAISKCNRKHCCYI